jgi:large subunit ribosomal protein L4
MNQMNKAQLFSPAKTVKETVVNLPAEFNESPNMALIAHALHVTRNRLHMGRAKTLTRGEVSLTKKKVWRQKGTGRARHGARSAPIFVGGGKAHGPTGERRILTLPKKMRRKALNSAFSLKAKENQIVLIEGLDKIKKTKDAGKLITKIAQAQKLKDNSKKAIFLSEQNAGLNTLFKNIKNIEIIPFRNANAWNVLQRKLIIIDQLALEKPKTKVSKTGEK